jgi:hypothetical protein
VISAIITLAALALAYFIARVLWGDYQAQRRTVRQTKCRKWIEWKLAGYSEVERYEAQCAFRMLMTDPEWPARGPWEWEELPRVARSRCDRLH